MISKGEVFRPHTTRVVLYNCTVCPVIIKEGLEEGELGNVFLDSLPTDRVRSMGNVQHVIIYKSAELYYNSIQLSQTLSQGYWTYITTCTTDPVQHAVART